jgi:N-ethylmaleimide reductase
VFGKPYIANPDLVNRMRLGQALAEADGATIYGGGAKGYVDYPTAD